jgi:hypothetical protein
VAGDTPSASATSAGVISSRLDIAFLRSTINFAKGSDTAESFIITPIFVRLNK